MATTTVTIKIDRPAVDRLVGRTSADGTRKAADITVARAKRNIQKLGRIDTSAMYRGMTRQEVAGPPNTATYVVYSTAPYTHFQEFGTRAHGPKRAKFMVFTPKGGRQKVFAKWVRGVTPGHFMRDAARALSARDFLT